MKLLRVRPQGKVGRVSDMFFDAMMRLLSGAPKERAQRTHRWNNHHLSELDMQHLVVTKMVSHEGIRGVCAVGRMPIVSGAFKHMPRVSNWKHYIVVVPENEHATYHIGWRWKGGGGVSRIVLHGPVRVLVGAGYTEWFAIDAKKHHQLSLTRIGEGIIGDEGKFSQLPLL